MALVAADLLRLQGPVKRPFAHLYRTGQFSALLRGRDFYLDRFEVATFQALEPAQAMAVAAGRA